LTHYLHQIGLLFVFLTLQEYYDNIANFRHRKKSAKSALEG